MDEKLTLALVAASSAVGGVLLTQIFSIIRDWFGTKHENRKLLREKYEILADKVIEARSHRVKVMNRNNDEFFTDTLNLPLEKIVSLSLLYFPELVEPSKNYYQAYIDFYKVLGLNYFPDNALSVGMQAVKDANDELNLVVEKLNQADNSLRESIQKHAHKYAKT